MRYPTGKHARMVRPSKLLLLLLGLTAYSPPLQTTWPKFHHDILQTGLSQFTTGTNGGAQKWKFAAGVPSLAIAGEECTGPAVEAFHFSVPSALTA